MEYREFYSIFCNNLREKDSPICIYIYSSYSSYIKQLQQLYKDSHIYTYTYVCKQQLYIVLYIYVCVCVYILNCSAVHLKLTRLCELTLLQYKKSTTVSILKESTIQLTLQFIFFKKQVYEGKKDTCNLTKMLTFNFTFSNFPSYISIPRLNHIMRTSKRTVLLHSVRCFYFVF